MGSKQLTIALLIMIVLASLLISGRLQKVFAALTAPGKDSK